MKVYFLFPTLTLLCRKFAAVLIVLFVGSCFLVSNIYDSMNIYTMKEDFNVPNVTKAWKQNMVCQSISRMCMRTQKKCGLALFASYHLKKSGIWKNMKLFMNIKLFAVQNVLKCSISNIIEIIIIKIVTRFKMLQIKHFLNI